MSSFASEERISSFLGTSDKTLGRFHERPDDEVNGASERDHRRRDVPDTSVATGQSRCEGEETASGYIGTQLATMEYKAHEATSSDPHTGYFLDSSKSCSIGCKECGAKFIKRTNDCCSLIGAVVCLGWEALV